MSNVLDFSDQQTIEAYDPQRKQVVRVPANQGKLLQDAGFVVGDGARQYAHAQGWGGATEAFAQGLLNGATAGISDMAMPSSAAKAAKMAAEAHPILHAAGQMAGIGAFGAATAGAGPALGLGARLMHGSVAGGMNEVTRANINNEPIQWERVVQGATLGGIFSGMAEAAGAGVAKIPGTMKKSLAAVAEKWPKNAAGEFRPFLDGEDFTAGIAANMMDTLGHHHKAIGALLGMNRAIPKLLNNVGKANAFLDDLTNGPAQAMGKTVTALTSTAGKAAVPYFIKDPDKEYQAKADMINHIASNPEGFVDSFSANYGHLFDEHQPLHTGTMITALQSVNALAEALPKNPYDPTPGGVQFNPPRQQKLDWLQQYHAVDNFSEAMQFATPKMVEIAERTAPESLNLLRQTIAGKLIKDGISGMSAHQILTCGVILGIPLTPGTSKDYISRLQQITAPPPPKPPKASGGPGGGGAKMATNVVLLDMPNNMRLQTGL